MNYKEKYNDWLSFADGETKSELLAAAGNEKMWKIGFIRILPSARAA